MDQRNQRKAFSLLPGEYTQNIGGSERGCGIEYPRSKPIRVLIVAPSFDILGGQSVQAAELVTHLSKEPSIEIGFLPINPRLPGVLRKLQAIKYVRTLVTSILYVAHLLFRVRSFDVIHVFSASYFSFVLAPSPAILIGKLYGKKVLLNYHSGEAEDHLTRWRRTSIPTVRLADALVVPSEYLVRIFDQFGLPARAIYNVIDLERFRFRKREHLQPVFLSNRNLESHYGVDLVLKAFAIIQEQFPEASLIVAGDGSQRDALKSLATSLGLRNTIFVGKIDPTNIAKHYDEADIYLNGSKIDNQPLSLLEAFACGLPIVTTDAGGIPDIVTDRKTGLLVEQGDYQKMAEAAMLLLKDSQFAGGIQQRGLVECEKYTWNAVREAWLAVYQELADVQIYAEDRVESASGSERKVLTL